MKKWSLILMLGFVTPIYSGVFEFAGENQGVNVIAHPTGYSGRGTELVVTVGISPLSPHASEMVISVKNAIDTWNRLAPTVGNVITDSNKISQREFDFESIALHELGHCIGLGHPNLASESGLTGKNKNFTAATKGANNFHDINAGTDRVIGSSDDFRGDDINLHWFRISDNNPFAIAEVVDITTYSRSLTDLPTGHRFVTNADRDVAALLGFPNTEAVMQQGILSGEIRRSLAADDVATLRLGMTGLDMLEDTEDDYTLFLHFADFTEFADIVLDFDNQSGFAACSVTGSFINSEHITIDGGHISFNTRFNWFFNDELTPPTVDEQTPPVVSITVNNQADAVTLERGDALTLAVSLEPGSNAGHQADYWVRADTPAGTFWLNDQLQFIRSNTAIRAFGGPLISLLPFIILDEVTTGFAPGTYRLNFAVDDNRDFIFDGTFSSTVDITINP